MDGAWLPVVLVSLLFIGAAVAAMAIGVVFRRPCLRGSCGGPAVKDAHGRSLSCVTCPNRGQHRDSASGRIAERRGGDVD